MTATFHVGDAIEVMSKLPEKSVDLVLTSPPFLALRSYLPADHPDKALEGGSQSTPAEFIDWLLDVAEACNRVLAPHGSLCIELGDTYSGSGGGGGDYLEGGWREGQAQFAGSAASMKESNAAHWRQKNPPHKVNRAIEREGVRSDGKRVGDSKSTIEGTIMRNQGGTGWPLAKSLSLIPESFRFAMVYGFNPHTGRTTEPWRLRNVVRWVRPNPPVGALGDKFRPATSELMVFCKSAKRYFDLDAVRGEVSEWTSRYAARPVTTSERWETSPTNLKRHVVGDTLNQQGAPPLDWWNIPPGGYEGAHYAVFPPELCVKPVKAMCPEKVCRTCGEPSRRIVEQVNEEYAANQDILREGNRDNKRLGIYTKAIVDSPEVKRAQSRLHNGVVQPDFRTVGSSDCGHDNYRLGLVLDPFAGSGTTLAVATGHGRDAIGIDLDERNFELALQRVGPFILERAS